MFAKNFWDRASKYCESLLSFFSTAKKEDVNTAEDKSNSSSKYFSGSSGSKDATKTTPLKKFLNARGASNSTQCSPTSSPQSKSSGTPQIPHVKKEEIEEEITDDVDDFMDIVEPSQRGDAIKRKIDFVDESDDRGVSVEEKKKEGKAGKTKTVTTRTPTTPVKKATAAKKRKMEEEDEDEESEEESSDDDGEPEEDDKKKKHTSMMRGIRRTRDTEKAKEQERRHDWLVNIRDAQMRRPGEPGYDPSTVYVPENAMLKPFERQFWDIKKNNYDTVIFFKVTPSLDASHQYQKGRFYELYENDADIGHEHIGLRVSRRVNMRMAGVPESHFIPYASKLISLGYKIGRVDQLETAIGKEKRQKNTSNKSVKDNIIRRELTKIYTAGTLVDEGLINSASSAFLLSVCVSHTGNCVGTCLVDTATGEFNLSYFKDDNHLTTLETLLTQTKPKEVLYESGIPDVMVRMIKRILYTALVHSRSFPKELDTLNILSQQKYFPTDGKSSDGVSGDAKRKNWPECLSSYQESTKPEMLKSLGACVRYLEELKMDVELVSLKNFKMFHPTERDTMALDGQSLQNLEILNNSRDGGEEGTLLRLLDHCKTSFGKRLFTKWLCFPLLKAADIEERLKSIDDLSGIPNLIENMRKDLSCLPDVERMISRVHAETVRVSDLIHVLEAFELILDIVRKYVVPNADKFQSRVLREMSDLGGMMEQMDKCLVEFSEGFNREIAKKDGTIVLKKGMESDYDSIMEEIEKTQLLLQAFLQKQKKQYKSSTICYKDINKSPYQLEFPKATKVPSEWYVVSQTKTMNRYYTPEIKEWVKKLEHDNDTLVEIRKTILSRLCKRFDANYGKWLRVIEQVATLDALLSLSMSKVSSTGPVCRPVFTESESSYLSIQELRHPCVVPRAGGDFIPNDIQLGRDNPMTVLLTGPNMGGKSTLLRQVCVAAIMAQMGCYVTATSCEMTPIDRIFTRLGANDDILTGHSTFMVELQETSNIMKHATHRSLVIMDELGRGTSTFDGYSIAYSVLDHLVRQVNCCTLFSTHYHMLTSEYENNEKVGLHHMACFVDEEQGDVTFLYKLTPGVCPKSYGMNVAKMAGIDGLITSRADLVAQEFERSSHQR
ncbi:hypothetical protein PROFUN_06478 [Planoprotostelium fungivorum]|uniref:DNA mismatch repair protein n=1 Tax=Planoprotostelium fungivorum TaxID=1890364 RepID=A0A2P6MR25_9EUKA|nr:hypothetical protein PROFUN_06478 [Planoprotostelium fungivorum]